MKRLKYLIKYSILLGIFIFGLNTKIYEAEAAENLVLNADFSEVKTGSANWGNGKQPTNWVAWFPNAEKPDISITDSGTIKISSEESRRVGIYQEKITIQPNTEYEAVVLAKGTSLTNARAGNIRIQYKEAGKEITINSEATVTGTTDWSPITVRFMTGEDVATVKITLFYDNATGTIEYKAPQIYEVKAVENLVLNADFSEVKTSSANWGNGIQPTNWVAWFPNTEKPDISVTDSGTIKISSEESRRMGIYQENITIHPNTEYKAVVHAKGTNLTGSRAGNMRIQYKEAGKEITINSEAAVTGTTDWSPITIRFKTGEDVATVKITLFYDNTAGTIEYKAPQIYDVRTEVLENITVSEETLELFEGRKSQLSYQTVPEDFTQSNLVFASLDESIATINAKGLVQAVSEGETTLLVSNRDQSVKKEIPITVKKEPIEQEISLSQDKLHFVRFSKKQSIAQVVNSNEGVAEFKDGIVYPKQVGTTEITIYNEENETIKVLSVTITEASNDVYDQMRQAWQDIILGDSYFDNESDVMVEAQITADSSAEILWDSLQNEEDRSKLSTLWVVDESLTASAALTKQYQNILQLGTAVMNPNSKYYLNIDLLTDVLDGVEWLYENKYNKNTVATNNWWDWEIGIARPLNDLLTMLYPFLTVETIEKYLAPIDKFVPYADQSRWSVSPELAVESTGANQVDISKVKIIQNILRKNSEGIHAAAQALEKIFPYVTSLDGFYQDGSFLQHDNVAYTGSYGNVLLDGTSLLLTLLQPTEFAVKSDEVTYINTWIQESFAPLMYKGNMMDMVRGRAISRSNLQSGAAGAEVIKAVVRIIQFSEPEEKALYSNMVKEWIVENQEHYDYIGELTNYRDIALANSIVKDDTIAAINPLGTQLINYASMDRGVYRNEEKDFAVGISMSSTRVKRYEAMNNENIHGWYTGDGMLYLYNNDLEQFTNDFWATVDPYRLPGITVEEGERKDSSGVSTTKHDFVGGSVLNEVTGTFVMDFTNFTETVSAKKSWSILDDKIVALGTAITNSGENLVETVIENRKLNDNLSYQLYINDELIELKENTDTPIDNVRTIYLEASDPSQSIGYQFIEPQSLVLKKDVREGSWRDVNATGNTEKITRTYLTIWQPHTSDNASYGYVIYPSITRGAFAEVEGVKVEQADQNSHIVSDGTGRYTANIFASGEYQISDVQVTQPMSLAMEKTDQGISLAITDPTMKQTEPYEVYVKDDGYEIEATDENIEATLVKTDKGFWKITIDPTNKNGLASQIFFMGS